MNYSVEVFKNINDNTLFFIPDGFDQHGIRSSINKPAVLKAPYDLSLIGATLRKCFNITVNHQYTDEDMKYHVTKLITGEKRKKFYKIIFFKWHSLMKK